MTDNEIIKALEYCANGVAEGCKRCPYGGTKWCITDAQNKLLIDTLNLINRQKADIERLEEMFDSSVSSERNVVDNIGYEKSEAIKEFAERLKEKLTGIGRSTTYGNFEYGTVKSYEIDNIVKKMTEVETNQRKEDDGK